jgi:stage II sporulation protein AA (anti-sigma F factor antagonist)
MKVDVSCRERDLTLQLHGEVDHHGAKLLIGRIEQEIEQALPLHLALDFSGVSFMDSSGIAVVMRCRQRMRELGGSLTLQKLPNQPRKVFETSGITRLVSIE